jgi:2-methylisocitrate lyase-like PEP mutase family enzyme
MINNRSPSQPEKAETFKGLHEREGAFIIPNPWDLGSARLLSGFGFEALATTSSGFANSLGRRDGQVSLDEVIAHCRSLCAATDLPISADLENCFADEPEKAAATILAAAQAGLVGASIEDYTGNPENPIYEFDLAVERVHAAAEAAHSLDFPFMLTARAENLLHGSNDLDDTIRRLQAFEKEGADVLYAPGLKTLEEVRLVTRALTRPVNVLAPLIKGVTVSDLADTGVKRISVGGTLARAAITALIHAALEMQNEGSFGWAANIDSSAEVQRLLSN